MLKPEQNVIVVGASHGGVEALRTIVSGLRREIAGSVFIVLPDPAGLAEILSSACVLPVVHPRNGQAIERAVIYVAPPDHHMLLSAGHIELSHGPKENHNRPAINPLFRSAAANYGAAVTGVILSGILDDGILGLAEIKREGGIAMVQDPKTALYPSMPSSAIESVAVDYVVGPEAMAQLLLRSERPNKTAAVTSVVEQHSSDLTCPECRGPLTEFLHGKLAEYRCRVGHAYSALALAQDHQSTVERKLWEAVLVLEESAEIADRLRMQFGGSYEQQGKDRREQASFLRELLNDVSVDLKAP